LDRPPMNDYGDDRGRDRGDDFDRRARDEGDRGDRGGWRDEVWERARARVHTPAVMLQLYGAILVALSVMFGVLCLINSKGMINAYYDWVEDMQKKQPQNQKQQLPPREESVKGLQIQGPFYGLIGFATGIIAFIGGAKMKQLKGYGWALAGSIMSIFPGLCCCCVGLIPGIWALVVLLNQEVKYAFSHTPAG
jgi:hypothetical protein